MYLRDIFEKRICFASVDVESDLRKKSFLGIEKLNETLCIFERHKISTTLFVTGEILDHFPEQIMKFSYKHEIASHGYQHKPLYMLSISERKKQMKQFCDSYNQLFGYHPKGFRAPQHSIDETQLKLLENYGFKYDSSIVPRYPLFKRYIGYKGKAPVEPYHPSLKNCREKGNMKILEIPNTPLIFGIPIVGTWIRMFGPTFYYILLKMMKPHFISLMVHSWDAVHQEGSYSRNSGNIFLAFLNDILGKLNEDYVFYTGAEIASLF